MAAEIRHLTATEAKEFLATHPEGSYLLLDVRQPAEYELAHLPGAKLIPLGQLEEALPDLNPEQPVLTYCAVGGRSRVAAQLLTERGFREVYNLQGGIKAWQGQTAQGPVTLHLDLLPPAASPTQAVALAVGMEESLIRFYQEARQHSGDPEAQQLFAAMIRVSEQHKKKFLEFWRQLEPQGSEAAFLATVRTDILEGGFRLEEFLQANLPQLRTLLGALEVAAILEAQAYDLYRRLAGQAELPATKNLLLQVAQEEKNHLNQVGDLLDRKLRAAAAAGGT